MDALNYGNGIGLCFLIEPAPPMGHSMGCTVVPPPAAQRHKAFPFGRQSCGVTRIATTFPTPSPAPPLPQPTPTAPLSQSPPSPPSACLVLQLEDSRHVCIISLPYGVAVLPTATESPLVYACELWVFAMCPALRGSTVSYAGDAHFPKHSLEYSLKLWSQSKKKKKTAGMFVCNRHL